MSWRTNYVDLMAVEGDKINDSELGGNELLVALIATGGSKTGELGEPEDNKPESNVAGGDMTGEFSELEDEALELNVTNGGSTTGKLGKLEAEDDGELVLITICRWRYDR